MASRMSKMEYDDDDDDEPPSCEGPLICGDAPHDRYQHEFSEMAEI